LNIVIASERCQLVKQRNRTGAHEEIGIAEGLRVQLASGCTHDDARISISGELITGGKPQRKQIVTGNHVRIAAQIAILPG